MVFRHRLGPELTAEELHGILRLRVAVFVVEQTCPYPEIDGRDLHPTTGHWWLEDAAGVTSYIRTLAEPDGTVRVGRVVTRRDRRSEGLSARLIEVALPTFPGTVTVLAAQSHLRGFYQRFGYEVDGPEFMEDGIPHLPMRREGN